MITSAREFIRLRTSDLKEEYDRAASKTNQLQVISILRARAKITSHFSDVGCSSIWGVRRAG